MLASCSNQTKLIVRVHHGMQFLNQKEFPIQLAQKKSSFSRCYRTKKANLIFSYRAFFIMLESFSNQTKLIVRDPHDGLQFLNQKEFPIQLAQKKIRSLVVFERNKGICFFHIQLFSKCQEVVKSNETLNQSSSWYVVSKSKRISDLAYVEKSQLSRCFRMK